MIYYFILRSYINFRFTSTATEGREDAVEAQELKANIVEASKRRRKKSMKL
jgi:hypothetical protein